MNNFFNVLFKLSRKSGIFNFLLRIMCNCDIPRKLKLGENVSFPHFAFGVVIHPDAIIENNVCVQHHVLIGEKNGCGAPIIHDNVIINPYSIIIGNVDIGENVVIGAGSVVTKSIPANSVYYNEIIPVIKSIDDKEYDRITK